MLHCNIKSLSTLTPFNQCTVLYIDAKYLDTHDIQLIHCTANTNDNSQHSQNVLYYSFAKEFGHPNWQGYGLFIHQWTKRYVIN